MLERLGHQVCKNCFVWHCVYVLGASSSNKKRAATLPATVKSKNPAFHPPLQHVLGGITAPCTFRKEFGTIVAQREVVRPLRIPPFAWCRGSAALAANTFGTYLEKECGWQVLFPFIHWFLCFSPNDAFPRFIIQ